MRKSVADTDEELRRATEVFEQLDIIDQQQSQVGAVPAEDLQVRSLDCLRCVEHSLMWAV